MSSATLHQGPADATLDGRCRSSAALAVFAALLMLGGADALAPPVATAVCGVALLMLLEARWGARAPRRRRGGGRDAPRRLPASAPLAAPQGLPAPISLTNAPAGVSPLGAETRAPLQRLAQFQGDHRFLLECRRNLVGRWLGLVTEMEHAWTHRDLGALRWALYQLRMQSTLWGMQPLSGQAHGLERLLEHAGTVGFDTRCERALARLRASIEGR